MLQNRQGGRLSWLALGMLAGVAIASIWPHEPLRAASSDRNQKFAMITCHVGNGNEGVFVLDFLTGRLTGACVGKVQGVTQFQYFYLRNVAEDFQVAGQGEAYYAISAGQVDIQARGNAQFGSSAIYVAELNSGKVGAYAIPFRIAQQKVAPVPLTPIGDFPFREANVAQ